MVRAHRGPTDAETGPPPRFAGVPHPSRARSRMPGQVRRTSSWSRFARTASALVLNRVPGRGSPAGLHAFRLQVADRLQQAMRAQRFAFDFKRRERCAATLQHLDEQPARETERARQLGVDGFGVKAARIDSEPSRYVHPRLRCSRTTPGIAPTDTYSATKSLRVASSIHATGSDASEVGSVGVAGDGPASEEREPLRTDSPLSSRVPRHSGNRGQPQNRPPAFLPVFAVRSTIEAPHEGHGGWFRGGIATKPSLLISLDARAGSPEADLRAQPLAVRSACMASSTATNR